MAKFKVGQMVLVNFENAVRNELATIIKIDNEFATFPVYTVNWLSWDGFRSNKVYCYGEMYISSYDEYCNQKTLKKALGIEEEPKGSFPIMNDGEFPGV